MALQVFFGDDEHTAKDGTYSRILRARKWLYLSAAVATILALGLYDAEAAEAALKVISLPGWLLSQAIAAGLAYLLIQYGLLLFQLAVTYDLVLSERLAFRRADELSAATDRVMRARDEFVSADTNFREKAVAELSQLERDVTTARDAEARAIEAASQFPAKDRSDPARKVDLERRLAIAAHIRANQERKLQELSDQLAGKVDNPEVGTTRQALIEADRSLERLRRQDPAARKGYSSAEQLIDIARVVPPLLVAMLSLAALLRTAIL